MAGENLFKYNNIRVIYKISVNPLYFLYTSFILPLFVVSPAGVK